MEKCIGLRYLSKTSKANERHMSPVANVKGTLNNKTAIFLRMICTRTQRQTRCLTLRCLQDFGSTGSIGGRIVSCKVCENDKDILGR